MKSLFNSDDIYHLRVKELRAAKIIEHSAYDLRKKLTRNEKRRINYKINAYDNMLALKSQDRLVTKFVKTKKAQKLFRKNGYTIINNRAFIQKTKHQKVTFKVKNGKLNIKKQVGKKVVNVEFQDQNILQRLENQTELERNQTIQLLYYGYGMVQQYDTVKETLEALMIYLETSHYSQSSDKRKKTLLARYSYSVITY